MTDLFLTGAVRTPIGQFNGAFADVSATELGGIVIRAALQRSGLPAGAVDEVIFGNVVSAGLGQNPARQAAIGGGLATSVGASTVNKVCGSGLKAVMMAAQAVRCGDAGVVVAGGMESMTRAPYLLPKARTGYKFGNAELVDSLTRDGLCDAYDGWAMGVVADRCASRYSFTRQHQDDYAVASHLRAREAIRNGWFADEIVAVEALSGKERRTIAEDEQPQRFDEAKLRKLRPAFSEDGTVTAGSSSSLNDGAAAVIVLSGEQCSTLGLAPQARILGYAEASHEPVWFTTAPIAAIRKLLDKLSLSVGDVDLFEINEAFACVPMAAMQEIGIPHEKLNIHGGALALGHPLGASGARVLVTLLHALKRQGGKIGIAALCIGGGEAVAMAIERL